ncbi:hypothetical protein D6D18_02656, partial [Aureobasidium pullulans]
SPKAEDVSSIGEGTKSCKQPARHAISSTVLKICGNTNIRGKNEAARGAGLIMDKCSSRRWDCDGREPCLG